MINSQMKRLCRRCFIVVFSVTVLLISNILNVNGQELPPRPMTVTVHMLQNLSFGAFYQGSSGGSVIISTSGSRSSTGDVVLLGMGYSFSAVLYDVVANPGTLVTINNGANATLTGSNGGSMTLVIGVASPASPFVVTTTPPTATQVSIGGTLNVGNPVANPPGIYSGTFNVTFIQQ
jgi:hypothetical protein